MGAVRHSVQRAIVPLFLVVACVPPDTSDLGTFNVTETLVINGCGAQLGSFQVASSYTADVGADATNGVFNWTQGSQPAVTGTYDPTSGAFSLEATSSAQYVAANTAMSIAGCIVDQTDVIQGIIGDSTGDGGIVPLYDVQPIDTGVDVPTVVDAGIADAATVDAVADVPTQGNGDGGIDSGLVVADASVVPVTRVEFTGTHQIVFSAESGNDCSSVIGGSPMQFSVLPCTITYTITGVRE